MIQACHTLRELTAFLLGQQQFDAAKCIPCVHSIKAVYQLHLSTPIPCCHKDASVRIVQLAHVHGLTDMQFLFARTLLIRPTRSSVTLQHMVVQSHSVKLVPTGPAPKMRIFFPGCTLPLRQAWIPTDKGSHMAPSSKLTLSGSLKQKSA